MLSLRGPHTVDDLEIVLDRVMLWINNKDVVKNLANFNHVFTKDEEREWLKKTLTSTVDKVYSIENGDEYVGQIGVHQIYWPAKHGRVSTIIREPYHHSGFGTQANVLVMDKAFNELNLNKLWAVVWADNPKTNAMLKRLGYKQAGTLRDEYVITTDKGIIFHDMNRYEMLKKDYDNLTANGYFEALLEPHKSRL